jgi:unsaturated chondroitin disaccharide hydrolase
MAREMEHYFGYWHLDGFVEKKGGLRCRAFPPGRIVTYANSLALDTNGMKGLENIMEQTIWWNEARKKVEVKVKRTSKRIGSGFPHASVQGRYDSTEPFRWTAGFWAGLLWHLYRDSGDPELRSLAEGCEAGMDEALDSFTMLHHDVGFMWCLTSVASYRLTGNETSMVRALKAASTLAARFNLKGGFIQACNSKNWKGVDHNAGWAIIDCMMNLSLLFWAWETTDDPRFRHIAEVHANTVLRDFMRPDGSCCHIVTFDPETGQRLETLGGQGCSPDSAWARGTAWSLYGLSICAAYTGVEKYLNGAKQAAHFFLANLPDDLVPIWDFRLPEPEGMPRDSSAAAIASSGLLLLAEQLPKTEARLYRSRAEAILQSIYERFTSWETEEEAIVLHGTGNYLNGKHIDVPLIYGDYFFVEALAKLRGHKELFW